MTTLHKLHCRLENLIISNEDTSALTFELTEDCDQPSILNEFKELGYTSPSRPIRDNKLRFKIGRTAWKAQVFYIGEEQIFEYADTHGEHPLNCMYFNPTNNKLFVYSEELEIHKKITLFLGFRSLLAELSDHSIPESGKIKGSQKVVLLVKNDDGGAKHSVQTTIDYEDFNNLFININLDNSLDSLSKLKQCIELDDQQDKERKNCMRSAFDSLIQTLSDSNNIFTYCMSNIVKLHKIYNEHHNIFISDFKINKVIQEINSKDLEYTGKINDITSSAQTKALAIPGAMIAISAVMRVDNLINAIGVVVALLATCIVIHSSLNIYNCSFKHIKKQITNVFSRYQVLNQKSEIREEAEKTEKDLSKMVDKAQSSMSFIKKIIWSIWLFSILFVWLKMNPQFITYSISFLKTLTQYL
ncbi:hypothetical protein PMAL9190_00216 [Photobacterium malacitanum]|uniref:Uncharacterized protein n=1 Tax=Photobacterium malacitanum TaxID=2204294 RepID=A0A1Y6M5G5_9GAMM|nr:hypothetical protein [Photobacterium malacitanum]SMY31822.1 hypothetical protein PMAL9190_00216 [Photobacterium malacitanum]